MRRQNEASVELSRGWQSGPWLYLHVECRRQSWRRRSTQGTVQWRTCLASMTFPCSKLLIVTQYVHMPPLPCCTIYDILGQEFVHSCSCSCSCCVNGSTRLKVMSTCMWLCELHAQISCDGKNVVLHVWKVLDKIKDFTDHVQNGTWISTWLGEVCESFINSQHTLTQ
jgi:hypothetical protein